MEIQLPEIKEKQIKKATSNGDKHSHNFWGGGGGGGELVLTVVAREMARKWAS